MPGALPIYTDDIVVRTRGLLTTYSTWRGERFALVASGAASGGTFTLGVAAAQTGDLPLNADAAAVQEALETLAPVGAGNVEVTGGPLPDTPLAIAFLGEAAGGAPTVSAALIGPGSLEVVPVGDFGAALLRVFGRLAQVAVDRLNQVPDKSFLAFLDLIGLSLQPPQAARAPLTFHLAAGASGEARVPAGTRAAAPPPDGETAAVVYETDSDLLAIPVPLERLFTRDPIRDAYTNWTATLADPAGGSPASVFTGTLPLEHVLYISSTLFAAPLTKDVTVAIQPFAVHARWPFALEWSVWDGTGWAATEASIAPNDDQQPGAWLVSLQKVPMIPPTPLADTTGAWLRARLTTRIPGASISVDTDGVPQTLSAEELPDAAVAAPSGGSGPALAVDPTAPFAPFLGNAVGNAFHLASDAFAKAGGRVTLAVDLDLASSGVPASGSRLDWSYSNAGGWTPLGSSYPTTSTSSTGTVNLVDTTGALRRSGVIGFTVPDDWQPITVAPGGKRYWLRGEIAGEDYLGAGPKVAALRVAVEWDLPRLAQLGIHTDASAAGPPQVAFANQTPVDLNKDFFPFGPKPMLNDTLYLASDAAFAPPKDELVLTITPTNTSGGEKPPPALPQNGLALAWEYWDGAAHAWQAIPGAVDTTSGLSVAGTVTFAPPPTLMPTDVNGQRHMWIRVRIAKGDYGQDTHYQGGTDPKSPLTLVPSTLAPPSLASVTIAYRLAQTAQSADAVLIENDFELVDRTADVAAGTTFAPFHPPEDECPTLYLGFGGQLPDAAVSLFFGLPSRTFRTAASKPTRPAGLAWEYWDGERFARLEVEDETQAFARRGLVTFVGPPSLAPKREFGLSSHWLRVRWERGDYPEPPAVERLLTNTTWGWNRTTVRGEILGSSTGEPGQSFSLTSTPVLPDQQIEVREPEQPGPGERAALEDEEGPDAIPHPDPVASSADIWVRWHEVVDFHTSEPRDRHYTLDHLTGDVRFGDGIHGLVPPRGAANIRAAQYRTGGGETGNRPLHAIAQLQSTVPYVDAVTNWEAADGGAAKETLDAAKRRGPRLLRHGERAVALVDFEDLALEASAEVARVLGVAAGTGGSAGVVIVARRSDPRPVPTLELLGRVEAYVRERLSPTFDFWVAGPGWTSVAVTAEVAPVGPEQATNVESLVLARLATFLHPVTGGLDGTGWPFGRTPYRGDLIALIEELPGVDHVRTLSVQELAVEEPPADGATLVFSGTHTITIAAEA